MALKLTFRALPGTFLMRVNHAPRLDLAVLHSSNAMRAKGARVLAHLRLMTRIETLLRNRAERDNDKFAARILADLERFTKAHLNEPERNDLGAEAAARALQGALDPRQTIINLPPRRIGVPKDPLPL